jgi:branched-chain amino acid transport system permease protein
VSQFESKLAGETGPATQSAAGSLMRRIRDLKKSFARQNWIGAILLFTILALMPALPFFKGWMASQASLVIIYIIAAAGLGILVGFTGLVSVGHGGFLAIGAYTSALLTVHFDIDLSVGLLAGAIAAGLVGCLLGLVFLRLSGAFMAIGTLGFAFCIGTIVNNVSLFEGGEGISLPPNHFFGIRIGDFGFYYVSLGVAALVTLSVFAITRSSTGRAFMALRDSERAAEASGVNRVYYRVLAFSISAAITGLAGVLNAHIVNFVSAEVYGDIWYSVDILVAVVVGGSATLLGPYLGGLFVVMVPYFFQELADLASILKGVALILVLLFAPAGVVELLSRPIRIWRQRQLLKIVESDPKQTRNKMARNLQTEASS